MWISLILLLMISIGNVVAHAGDAPLEIETRASWMSVGQPEVHLLVKNLTDEPEHFSLWLGRGQGRRDIKCAANLSAIDPKFYRRFDRVIGISQVMTNGVIPAKGWTHRSLPVGASGGVPPCRVPFSLSIDDSDRVDGEIEIPADPTASHAVSSSEVDIGWESMVERDQGDKHRVIIRLLARNRGRLPIRVSISNRSLRCAAEADWQLHGGTLQGEDVGPVAIAPGSWAVFVHAVRLGAETDPESCIAGLELSALLTSGVKPVARAEFELKPIGEFDVPNVRQR